MPSFTVPKVVKGALLELGVQDPGETTSAADQAGAIDVLNRMLDGWNADRQTVYATAKSNFTLTPDLNPHTIGPTGGTFTTATNRPVSIDGANLVLTGGERLPIAIRDTAWYMSTRLPALGSNIPTDLYYEPNFSSGLGNLFFWPVPDTAYTVDLWMRVVLSQVTSASSVDLPPGYLDAITLTLAEKLAPSYRSAVTPDLARLAWQARERVFSTHHETPRIATADSGLRIGSSMRDRFNYLNGGLS
jgi:hypothetical protein